MSTWDKLLEMTCSLSNDMRFNELRKVLESYGYEMHRSKGAAAIVPFVKRDAGRLQFQEMTQYIGRVREITI